MSLKSQGKSTHKTKSKITTKKHIKTRNIKTSSDTELSVLIHISGMSGAGKSTLCRKLSSEPNILVIDTDDIDDPNNLLLIPKYSLETDKSRHALMDEVSKLNKTQIDQIINEARSKNKNIVIVILGFLHPGMRDLAEKITRKYYITIDAEKLWRQYNLRTATAIHDNYNEIKTLLTGNLHPEKIHFIMSHKMGIRNGFDCAGIDDLISENIKHTEYSKANGFICMTGDKIYNDVLKFIKQNSKSISIKRSRRSKHIITGGGDDSRKIKINESNSKIICINSLDELNAYKTDIMRITGICEPDDKDENGNVIEPQMNPPHDKYWLILYKESETGNTDLAGYIKTSDLEQYKGEDCFEKLGGISDKRGIQLSGVCANTEKYSGVASPLLNKIDEFAKAEKYDYILLHAGTTRDYLISDNRDRPGLYVKHKYKKVGNLKANECGFADIPLVIMRKEFQRASRMGGQAPPFSVPKPEMNL